MYVNNSNIHVLATAASFDSMTLRLFNKPRMNSLTLNDLSNTTCISLLSWIHQYYLYVYLMESHFLIYIVFALLSLTKNRQLETKVVRQYWETVWRWLFESWNLIYMKHNSIVIVHGSHETARYSNIAL